MNCDLPFNSIESAHEFVALLAKVALEAKCDIDTDIQREMSSSVSRRLDALQIVVYKLKTLEKPSHSQRSSFPAAASF